MNFNPFNIFRRFRRNNLASPPERSAQATAENQALIKLHQVIKTYETPAGPFTALKNIDLQVNAGEFAAVIGKSGSGKSTLINMITGIDRPTLGEVWIGGVPIHHLNEDQMALWRGQDLGVIFQFFQLLPTLTLLENVMLPMQLSNTYAGTERTEKALHLLDMVGLASQAHKFPSAISGGQQQRVAIARALANDPKVLVADEPTGSLDSKTADSIFQLFEDFVDQGRTILMVTHDRDLASRVSRVILIADGEITDQYISKALHSLSQQELVQVSAQLDPISYPPGETIFKQGDPADKFYIIIKGQVEVVVPHESGEEVVSATLSKGQFFGEMGLLQGGTRTATIRATNEAEVILMALERDTFSQLMGKSDLTHEAIAKLMRQRISADRMLSKLIELDNRQEPDLKSERLQFEPGQVIIRQGESGNRFYFITKGEVEVIKETETGETLLARLSSGQYFGEIDLLYNRRRSATVRAAQDRDNGVEVIAVGKAVFDELRLSSDEAGDDLIKVADNRRLVAKMADFGFTPDEN